MPQPSGRRPVMRRGVTQRATASSDSSQRSGEKRTALATGLDDCQFGDEAVLKHADEVAAPAD